jgi:hypothetical protein
VAGMKYLNKEFLADGVIFSGMMMNVIFICLIMYLFVL